MDNVSRVVVLLAALCGSEERAIAGDHSFRRTASVDQYGALGNGTLDDREAIERAISDVRETGGPGSGGIVQFGADTYYVLSPAPTADAAFTIGGPITFRGVGPGDPDVPGSGTVIFWKPNVAGAPLMKVGFRNNYPTEDVSVGGVGIEDAVASSVDFVHEERADHL
jgi:hypothetical protein